MLLGGGLRFSIRGNTHSADAYRSVQDEPELFAGSPIFAPGYTPSSPVDINMFHYCYGHVSNRLSEATGTQRRLTLEGDFRRCVVCSIPKVLRKPIPPKTSTRATKKLSQAFVDLN